MGRYDRGTGLKHPATTGVKQKARVSVSRQVAGWENDLGGHTGAFLARRPMVDTGK